MFRSKKLFLFVLIILIFLTINGNSKLPPTINFYHNNNNSFDGGCKNLYKLNDKYTYYLNRFFLVGDNSVLVKKNGNNYLYQFLIRSQLSEKQSIIVLVKNKIDRSAISFNNDYRSQNISVVYPTNSFNKLVITNYSSEYLYIDEVFIEVADKIDIDDFCFLVFKTQIDTIDRVKIFIFNNFLEIVVISLCAIILSILRKNFFFNFIWIKKLLLKNIRISTIVFLISIVLFFLLYKYFHYTYISFVIGLILFILLRNFTFTNDRNLFFYSSYVSIIIASSATSKISYIVDSIIFLIMFLRIANEFYKRK